MLGEFPATSLAELTLAETALRTAIGSAAFQAIEKKTQYALSLLGPIVDPTEAAIVIDVINAASGEAEAGYSQRIVSNMLSVIRPTEPFCITTTGRFPIFILGSIPDEQFLAIQTERRPVSTRRSAIKQAKIIYREKPLGVDYANETLNLILDTNKHFRSPTADILRDFFGSSNFMIPPGSSGDYAAYSQNNEGVKLALVINPARIYDLFKSSVEYVANNSFDMASFEKFNGNINVLYNMCVLLAHTNVIRDLPDGLRLKLSHNLIEFLTQKRLEMEDLKLENGQLISFDNLDDKVFDAYAVLLSLLPRDIIDIVDKHFGRITIKRRAPRSRVSSSGLSLVD